MNEDCILVFCKVCGDSPLAIPITSLKKHLKECSLKQLCDRYACRECAIKLDTALCMIEAMGTVPEEAI